MAIVGIDAVTYGVNNLDKAKEFYSDFGLRKIKGGKKRVVFETQNHCQIILEPKGAKDLPPAFEKGSSLRLLTWGVSSKADLARLRMELAPDHEIHDTENGGFWTLDPSGIPIGFRLKTRRALKKSRIETNSPVGVQRVNQRAKYYDKADPLTIGHCVFNVPSIKEAEKFYTKRLGFHVSDIYEGRGVFLRCAARHGHHNLFFLEAEDGKTVLNHVAFGVRDIHELFGGGQNMGKKGWKTGIGPGRHHISSCYFWYFKSPAGAMSEYFWDEDFPTEDWKPKRWDPAPETFAEWVMPTGLPRAATQPPTREKRDMKLKPKKKKAKAA